MKQCGRAAVWLLCGILAASPVSVPAALAAPGRTEKTGADSGASWAETTITDPPVLADGTYRPSGFRFEGGTGKLTIACDSFTVEKGEAKAEVVFSSRYISYVKEDGTKYQPERQDGSGTAFLIPIQVNADTAITACTTAMSAPHEIEYTLHLSYGQDTGSGAESALSGTESGGSAEPALSSPEKAEDGTASSDRNTSSAESVSGEGQPPQLSGLAFEKKTSFSYATGIDIYYYQGGYKFYDVHDSAQYLQIPEGGQVPSGLDDSVQILPAAPSHVYLAASAAMALINAIGGLDDVAFSGLKADGWYVDAAKKAMEEGRIAYAGNYSKPDYEQLVNGGCDLAVESTMILHTPKVKEMLEKLGIPVFVDRSSYESDPLGRPEWVKVYGALLGCEKQADAFFKTQTDAIRSMGKVSDTGKTAAFFYVDSNGAVVVRRPGDTVPKMIAMAGGHYALDGVGSLKGSKLSSVPMTMEEFYAAAADAAYLIYNASIEQPLHSLDDLYQKNSLFRKFKACQNGNVWCADRYLYQATDITAQLITDFHEMLTEGDESRMTFLTKVK